MDRMIEVENLPTDENRLKLSVISSIELIRETEIFPLESPGFVWIPEFHNAPSFVRIICSFTGPFSCDYSI